jgi:hypothetical protein
MNKLIVAIRCLALRVPRNTKRLAEAETVYNRPSGSGRSAASYAIYDVPGYPCRHKPMSNLIFSRLTRWFCVSRVTS